MAFHNSARLIAVATLCISLRLAHGGDYFLVIGGGYSPDSNQASLERNVVFFQRLLARPAASNRSSTILFADGNDPAADVQIKDVTLIPQANRLMAEFFGTEEGLGVSYRDNSIDGLSGAATQHNIREWFASVGPKTQPGDRLFVYVTAHGHESDDEDAPYQTTIALWDDEQLTVSEFARLLDRLPAGLEVVTVMVQCHAGGFARIIYEDADPAKGLAKQQRCGFFATTHDRIAAGCTAEVDEATYVEYSTYFWEALGGESRSGIPVDPPDYDGDGRVTFTEAHAYTLINADTIDMPISTSDCYLREVSRFRDDVSPELLPREASYAAVYELATRVEQAVLEGLSIQLNLSGDDRIETARRAGRRQSRGRRGRFRGNWAERRAHRIGDEITHDLQTRWPALANVLNPGAIELLTNRSAEFESAVTNHPRYAEYRDARAEAAAQPDREKLQVRYQRFVRAAETVILRENLPLLGKPDQLAEYHSIRALEDSGLAVAASSGTMIPTSTVSPHATVPSPAPPANQP